MDPSTSTLESEQVAQVNGQATDGQRPTIEVIPGTNLYVKNLVDTVDDEQLKKLFDRFGTITSAKVMTHEGGRSRGFGFVCFTTVQDASNAMAAMNGHIFENKPLYVGVAQKKEERRLLLSRQYKERQMAWGSGSQAGSQPSSQAPTPIPSTPVAQPTTPNATNMVPGHVSPAHSPLMTTPPTQFGGMNSFMLMTHGLGQPATGQPGYIFAPSLPPTTNYSVYGQSARGWAPTVFPIQPQNQGIANMRYSHHVPQTTMATASIPLNPAVVRPMQQSYNTPAMYSAPPYTVPIGYGHSGSVNSYPGVAMHPFNSAGVAAAAFTPHPQTRWGLQNNQE